MASSATPKPPIVGRTGLRPVARRLVHGARRLQRMASMQIGQISSTRPLSEDWGWANGTPVDRYYIERFLADHSGDIRGTVLEAGDDAYSRRFGAGRVTEQHIIHVNDSNPAATIVGDVCQPATLSPNAFDCILLTQTLQYVFDVPAALKQIRAALRPGGVALLTVPAVTALGHDGWQDSFYWGFTAVSMKRLLAEAFEESSVEVNACGNLYAATAFLHAATMQELNEKKLATTDPTYAVVICARAVA